MPVVIRSEGLGKCYRIRHEHEQRYLTLRDTLADRVLAFAKRKSKPEEEIFWALRDISFEIREGERVGIIGRNGAGKSTLLKLLSRITEPSTGRVGIRGRLSSLLEVGTGFHPELTGRENIYLNGAILGMRHEEIRLRFDEIVDFADAGRFLDTPVKRYSSGMHVRLAFAVAAHLEPEVLIVDEVLSVGDIAFQRKCLGKMRSAASSGRTIMFVSHNLSAIKQLCDRVFLLDKGRLIQSGEPETVLNSYLDLNRDSNTGNLGSPESASSPIYSTKDGSLRIQGVFTADAHGRAKTSFHMDEPVSICCHVVLDAAQENLHFYARVFTAEGLQVFATADWDEQGMAISEYQPGEYQLTITIPAVLLNMGDYVFSLEGVVPGNRYVFRAGNLLAWKILPVGGVGGMASVNRAGVVRPMLSWRIENAGA